MSATLLVISEPGLGRKYRVERECLIGRHDDCHVQLVDTKLSLRHARVFSTAQGYSIESLSEDYSVLLNGRRISRATALRANDRIVLGDCTFAFNPEQEILAQENGERALVLTKDSALLQTRAQLRVGAEANKDARRGLFFNDVVNVLATASPAEMLPRVVQRMGEHISFDAAAILATSEDGPEPAYIHSPKHTLSLSRTLVGRVLQQHEALLLHDAMHDAVYGQAASVVTAKVRSVLLAPIMLNQSCVGVVYLTRDEPNAYNEADLTALMEITPVLSLTLNQSRRFNSLRVKLQSQEPLSAQAPNLLGESPPLKRLNELVRKAAMAPSSVLITGETGTGKELIARSLHAYGRHPDGPFIAVNCGALPENLVESEFFGHQRGAYTGADRDKPGRLEMAAGGTLFLDEIGDLPLAIQVKLLRVLEEKSFYRLGGVKAIKVQFRLIAATHRDVKKMVRDGKFREDLYFRLNVLCIETPSLRERISDLDLLVPHFLREFAAELGKGTPVLAADTLSALKGYAWPGNVRELRNVIERLVVLGDGEMIRVDDLPMEFRRIDVQATVSGATLPEQVASLERGRISETMREVRGRKIEAARLLGISRPTLDKKIRDYGIDIFAESD